MSSSAPLIWQGHVYERISHKLGLQAGEQEDIQLLKAKAETMRDLRRKLLKEKHD